MSKVRNGLIHQISETLSNNKNFSREDFLLISDTEYVGEIVRITYLPEEKFTFKVIEHELKKIIDTMTILEKTDEEKVKQLQTVEVPGDYKEIQKVILDEFPEVTYRIEAWLKNLHSEIIYINEFIDDEKPDEELFKSFEKNIGDFVTKENEGDLFTKNEIKEIKNRLGNIEAKLSELEKSDSFSKEEVKSVTKVITTASTNLPKYPRKIWYRQTTIRLLQVFKSVATSKEAKNIAASAVKKLLGL